MEENETLTCEKKLQEAYEIIDLQAKLLTDECIKVDQYKDALKDASKRIKNIKEAVDMLKLIIGKSPYYNKVARKRIEEKKMEKKLVKKTLKEYEELIDAREKLLEKGKKDFLIFNSLYNLISKDKTTDIIFEFRKEEIEQEQKNIAKLKEILNKYKNKLEEIEDEIK